MNILERGKRKGETERWIAHKLNDEYMLRVIYEVNQK
jgi:hypothetical protein